MLKIRCKVCNTELISHHTQAKCCGCDNLTTVKGETVTALDLSLVELINSPINKNKNSYLSKDDLAEQESRRKRKVRRLDFEIR